MPKTIFSAGQECLQKLLRETRVGAGLTQLELAKWLQQPQSFVSKFEGGERCLDLIELRDICRALRIPLLKFVSRFEKRQRG